MKDQIHLSTLRKLFINGIYVAYNFAFRLLSSYFTPAFLVSDITVTVLSDS